MVKNSKNKFITVTSMVAAVSAAFLIAAIISTDWVNYSTTDAPSVRSGIFQRCTGSSCVKYSPLQPNVATRSNCFRSAGDLMDRYSTVAGTILSGSGIVFVLVLIISLQLFGCTSISPAGHKWVSFFFCVAAAVSLIGVVLYGATMTNWIGCGEDVCARYDVPGATTSCSVGFSYIFTVVGTILFCLCALIVMVYTRFPEIIYPSGDVLFLVSLVALVATTLNIVGVATDNWLVITPNNYFWGLWKQCSVSQCTTYPTEGTIVAPHNNQCTHDGSEIRGRMVAMAVLAIFSASGMFLIFFVFFVAHFVRSPLLMFRRSRKLMLMVFMLIVLAAQVTVLVIWDNTTNSWYLCGTRLCDYYSGSCSFGISYGFNLTSICLTAFLFIFHVFEFNDWCCFEERFASGRQTFSVGKYLRDAKKNKGKEPTNPASQQEQEDADEEMEIVLPPGNWEYDSVSGFYWCEELYLFYDPDSRQYYDPQTDQWINTERNSN
jgi:hypothetical protein